MLGSMGMGSMSWEDFQLIKAQLGHQRLIKADVANIQHGVAFTGGFTPLVAQSLDALWTSETFDDTDMCFTNLLEEVDINSPLHEVVTVKEWGSEQGIEGFFAEGGSPELEDAELARKVLNVKYIAARQQITDPASMTGVIGRGMVSKDGLARKREMAMMSLKGRYETALVQADSSLSPLHFDGLRAQILANSPHIFDKRGAKVTLDEIVSVVFRMADPPAFAKVDAIVVPSTMMGQLINLAQAYGRFSLPGSGDRHLVYNAGKLSIVGPGGEIEIKAAPKMMLPQDPPTKAYGKAPALVGGDFTVVADASGTPLFTAAEYGDYYYKVQGVGDKGAAAAYTSAAITIGATQRTKFTIDDAGDPTSGDNSVRYYNVFRSTKDGAASTAKLMGRFARNEDGGGDETIFYDGNENIPKTADIYALTTKRRSIYVGKLLGTTQRPLAEIETAKPFLIMRFCAPHVQHPTKQALWRNVDQGL